MRAKLKPGFSRFLLNLLPVLVGIPFLIISLAFFTFIGNETISKALDWKLKHTESVSALSCVWITLILETCICLVVEKYQKQKEISINDFTRVKL